MALNNCRTFEPDKKQKGSGLNFKLKDFYTA